MPHPLPAAFVCDGEVAAVPLVSACTLLPQLLELPASSADLQAAVAPVAFAALCSDDADTRRSVGSRLLPAVMKHSADKAGAVETLLAAVADMFSRQGDLERDAFTVMCLLCRDFPAITSSHAMWCVPVLLKCAAYLLGAHGCVWVRLQGRRVAGAENILGDA